MSRLRALQAEHDLRCDTPAYPEASSDLVRTLYLGSPALQRAVDEQLANLKSGVPCDEVDRALRAAQFPLTSIESIPAMNRPPLRVEPKPARP